jgi:hypothetical protein
MSALSTNYGAPAKGENGSRYANGSGQDYSLNSLAKESTLANVSKAKEGSVPQTRWDVSEHHASVISKAGPGRVSSESRQNIISKHTDWTVEYEGQGRSHSRGQES